jgi:hypothetical protein
MSKYFKIVLLLLLISQIAAAQKLINSPYARFGPGQIEPEGLFKTRAMGGASIALRDPVTLNYLNPASYTSMDTISFVFDFGLDFQMLNLDNGLDTYSSDDINFHHIVMGFPLSRWGGFVFGMVPYSSGYYNIFSYIGPEDIGYDPIIGETENRHKGTGGYNKFFAGIGISPIKHISLGVNLEYLSGSILRNNTFSFLDDNNFYNNTTMESILISGLNFTYGMQFDFVTEKDYFINAGITYTPKKVYNSEYEEVKTRYSTYTGSVFSTDTLSYTSDDQATVTLPQSLKFGAAFGKTDKYTIIADYTMTKWSESNFFTYNAYLVNSNSLRVGLEFIPDKFTNSGYFNRVEYRLGGHISDSHLMLNNEQLKDFGITFGVGLPMVRSKSRINLQFEYGSRKGSFDNGLHNENYYNIGLSFNFHDKWFEKRKYN